VFLCYNFTAMGCWAGCFVLLAAIHVVAPLPEERGSKTTDHQKQSASPQEQPQDGVSAKEGKKPDVQQQRGPSEQKPAKPSGDDPDYTLWALIINGVLTLITLGIAVAAVFQAIAAKDSAEIAMNARRSWIVSTSVDNPDFTNPWIQHMACHFNIIGSSPVRVIEANIRIRVVTAKVVDERSDTREPDLPSQPDYKDPNTLENSPAMGRIRPPGEPFNVVPMLESLFLMEGGDQCSGGEDVKAIRSRDKFLCAYGFVRYRDAFYRSKMRETRFCYVYHVRHGIERKGTEGWNIGGPPAYNEAT
jgi:hypothetical protein